MENKFFAILDENNIVINAFVVPNQLAQPNGEEIDLVAKESAMLDSIQEQYPGCILKQYGTGITVNDAAVGYIYNIDLNAFIRIQPDPTYILNTETFEWEPDQTLEYDLHGDGQMYKWVVYGWQPVPPVPQS